MGPPSPSLSRRASRPLPSPLSFTGACPSYCRGDPAAREDLPRQGDIGLRAFAFAIELHGGGPEFSGPCEPHLGREPGLVPPLSERFLEPVRHLLLPSMSRG